ncbi:hypothetical protein Bca101_083100 [Brassica carinata]
MGSRVPRGSDYTEKGLAAFEICSKGKDDKPLIWISSSGEKRLKLASVSKIVPRQELPCKTLSYRLDLDPELGFEICGANDNQARRYLVCGLPANRIKPQLHQQPRQEADDDQGTDVEEITRIEFRLSMGYFVRIEEPEEDIDPMFRRVVQKLKENACPKREQGESSRGKSHR